MSIHTKFTTIQATLYRSDESEIDAVEHAYGVSLPKGYRELMCELGEGILGGWLRFYPPRRIQRGPYGQQDWLERIRQYWFWGDGNGHLNKNEALRALVFADSLEGDEIVCHPDKREQVFVLPRHSNEVFALPNTIDDIIRWFFSSGILVEAFEDWSFEPFDTSKNARQE